ncbi:MAG: sugar ABC transporter permease [Verrucomicrobia bacterium]|nr:sugar ABC transporter permease [Verrucomicrobiota bacterium]
MSTPEPSVFLESPVVVKPKRRAPRKINLVPWIFLAPAVIVFATYVVIPIFQSFWLSLYDWDGLSPTKKFLGLSNYTELFQDDQFWTSLKNNLYWLILFLLGPVVGLAIAIFLNQKIRAMRIVKSLFFFPFVLSGVVIGLVFSWFYEPAHGLLSTILSMFGLPAISPLSDEHWVTPAIIAAGLWPQIAYCMILYLTGLTAVDPEQIEAARIDGARGMKMLWHVIMPQLRPATFIAVVVTIIGALRSFDLVQVMTDGGPFGRSSILAYFMFQQSITNFRMGYGAAIAVVLFLIMSVFIALFLRHMIRNERT